MPIGSICQAPIALRGIPYRQYYYTIILSKLQGKYGIKKSSKGISFLLTVKYQNLQIFKNICHKTHFNHDIYLCNEKINHA